MKTIEMEKRKKFKKLLRNLVNQNALKSTEDKDKIIKILRTLYVKNDNIVFHHFYSDIFPILTELKKEKKPIEIVGENLQYLYKYIDNSDILKQSVRKLLDHTNLEIARINYITSIDARMGMTGQELRTKYDEIRKIASEIEPKVEDLSKKANSSYSEFISILGIFSAVVLVYFGGTTILGNVLTTMNKTFILKSVAVSLIVGIIVLNIIFVFIYFLSKILGRSIASGDEEYWYSNIFIKVKEKYPIIYYVNAFFVLFLILDVMLWIMYYLNGYCDFTQFIFNYVSKGNARTKAIFALLGLLIIIDAVFIIYYISGKILKERTGNIIDLKYSVFSPLYRDTDNDCRYTFDESGNRKDFKERKDVIGYYFRKRSNEFYVKIVNFKRRLFNRYPRILWFNIVILVVIFIISVNL